MEQVPSREAWGDLDAEIELRHGFEVLGGKSVEEVLPLFIDNPIERAAGIQFAPAEIFNYYIRCLVLYLLSPESAGASDAASVFLTTMRFRTEHYLETFKDTYATLWNPVYVIAGRQSFYEATESIYGSFKADGGYILAAFERLQSHGV